MKIIFQTTLFKWRLLEFSFSSPLSYGIAGTSLPFSAFRLPYSPSSADVIEVSSKSKARKSRFHTVKRITRKYTMIYCYPINHITVNCSHQSSLTIAHNEIFIVVVSPWYQNPPPSRRSRVFGDPRLASCLAFRNGSLLTVILLLWELLWLCQQNQRIEGILSRCTRSVMPY